MSDTTLGMPITEGGIASVNFFNGRLLTGQDLSREQDARRLADQRVGQAMGAGIAWGLDITAQPGTAAAQVRVSAGVGVTPAGQVLKLATDLTARLVQPMVAAATPVSSGFGACQVAGGGPYVGGDGLYLLTLAPALKADGIAPVLALEAVNTRCATDAWIEAVQLRLLSLTDWQLQGTDPAAVARLRNQAAYACFAAEARGKSHARPGLPLPTGWLAPSQLEGLTACDLPLALVYLRGADIVFVDNWSVRRRLAAPAAGASWEAWLGEPAQALAEAQVLQFQAQLEDQADMLLSQPARAMLDWLPPAGFLPPGDAWKTFLDGRVSGSVMPLASGDAPAVLAAALHADPVKISDAADTGRWRVHRVAGDARILFVRDLRNVHAAEQVWLDGARSAWPGVADVQAAIDRLRAGTCLHLVLRPDMGQAAIQASLDRLKGQNASISFEAGDYLLKRQLTLQDAGSVWIRGPGACLRNAEGECALLVLNCASADVRQLRVEGGQAGVGKDDLGIGTRGALTFVDTPVVVVDAVDARCANGLAKAAAGIVAHRRPADDGVLGPFDLTVSACRVSVGEDQEGILCCNVQSARLRDNVITEASPGTAYQRGLVVAGRRADDVVVSGNVVRGAGNAIKVAISDAGGQPLDIGRAAIDTNELELRLTRPAGVDPCGILLGNAICARLTGNHVKVITGEGVKLEWEGMRLSGRYGPQLAVRDNCTDGCWRAIKFSPNDVADPTSTVWLIQGNVAMGQGALVLWLAKQWYTAADVGVLPLRLGGNVPWQVAATPTSTVPAPPASQESEPAQPLELARDMMAALASAEAGSYATVPNTHLTVKEWPGGPARLSYGPFTFTHATGAARMTLEMRFVVDGKALKSVRLERGRKLYLTSQSGSLRSSVSRKLEDVAHTFSVEMRALLEGEGGKPADVRLSGQPELSVRPALAL